jgi:Rne/Rng family ribonuclease
MSKELVISANRHETKVAILEDDQLVEVFFQRANEYSLAGSIHKGRVTRVLPGMQSAFVDLGLERDTFLYVSDFFEEAEEDFDRLPDTRGGDSRRDEPRRDEPRREREHRPPVSARTEDPAVRTEPEAAAGGEPSETAPVAAQQPKREDDGRDRRGRSRRRRSRGRGFPDSKYASTESRHTSEPGGYRGPRPVETAAAPVESHTHTEAAAPTGPVEDFAVLPGESLAKYSRSNVAPLDDGEEEEIRGLQSPVEEEPEIIETVVEELVVEEVAAQPDPPFDADEGVSGAEISAAEILEGELSEREAAFQELMAEEEAQAASEPEGEVAELAAEAIELEAGETEPSESETSEASEPSETQQQTPPAQGLTAQVREQGGRYGHRMPRRMRRKMRGGGGGGAGTDNRVEQERRPDPAAAAAPPVETRSARPEQSRGGGRSERPPMPSISELLKEGQEIIVQIAKEPLGQKGARITSHIALPGRYVVYMPTVEHTGVSRKIASDEERLRLKRILQAHHGGAPGGFIVRTAGEGKSEEDIASDMNFLANLWTDIRQKAEKRPAPLLLHHDLDIVQRTLRDQFTEQFKDIWVDNEDLYERILGFVQRFHPSLVPRVKLYTRPEPIFDAFNITAELEKALRPKVWLKSGGYIVINQTEALVAIDVNTGKYVGRSNRLEDTIVKTNTEAVKEIVRQVRLRDLGGIIVVDFIDMDERKNRQKVMQALEDAMRADRAPYKILQFNDFGLVAITRKRVKQSLERSLCMPCPHCDGAGYVKSVQTIVGEILQEAHKIASTVEGKDAMLRVHPDVAKVLKSNQNKYLEELEEILRRPVLVRADPLLHHEKFDLT